MATRGAGSWKGTRDVSRKYAFASDTQSLREEIFCAGLVTKSGAMEAVVKIRFSPPVQAYDFNGIRWGSIGCVFGKPGECLRLLD